ncbi:O-sialoglycoprotein endopeptidase [Bacillaceae bacterium]
MNGLILGIDTSNYMTSLCLVDLQGALISEARRLLPVREGKKGVQQSEAVFQHVMQLPELAGELALVSQKLVAVAVSTAPRPAEGSYMPVFKVGEGLAKCLALFHRIPCFTTTHQEGHVAAGEFTATPPLRGERFIAVHLSGGTSEILACRKKADGYEIERLGGTIDLHAGQLIDRVGVAMGLPFPAGPHLEKLAREAEAFPDSFAVPSYVEGFDFSFSGPTTALLKAVAQGTPFPLVARAAEQCISNTLEKALRKTVADGIGKDILLVGGVAANEYIRNRLRKRLEHPAVGARLSFADPRFSGDNAFGVARIGLMKYRAEARKRSQQSQIRTIID